MSKYAWTVGATPARLARRLSASNRSLEFARDTVRTSTRNRVGAGRGSALGQGGHHLVARQFSDPAKATSDFLVSSTETCHVADGDFARGY